jgi:omega-amidase
MKIGTWQFKGSSNIEDNYYSIKRGIEKAAKKNVKFLLTQECALCGYPPIEIDTILNIDFKKMDMYIEKIKNLAKKHQIYIGLGVIKRIEDKKTNCISIISPNGKEIAQYNKRALWGWDKDNFMEGEEKGIFEIDGIKMGIRICFEIRFPEYFRELFRENVKIAFVSFCDNSKEENKNRYNIIKSHLVTRSVENIMYIVSSNTISLNQTAPTIIIDRSGNIVKIAPKKKEALLVHEYFPKELSFGHKGIEEYSKRLL